MGFVSISFTGPRGFQDPSFGTIVTQKLLAGKARECTKVGRTDVTRFSVC